MRGAARRESSSFAWSTPPEDVGGFNFLRSVYYMDPCIRIRTYQFPCNGRELVQLVKDGARGICIVSYTGFLGVTLLEATGKSQSFYPMRLATNSRH
jgi:hypothetical protein